MTVLPADVSDLYEEKVEGDKYLFKGQWLPLKYWREVIKIKGQEPLVITVWSTHHGPIIEHLHEDFGKVLYAAAPFVIKGDISFAWAGHKKDDNFGNMLIKLWFCRNVQCAV